MMKVDHAVIVGGGFSGALLAINLLRHGNLKVTLVERHADRLGRGLAYGAAQAGHVLNVRAANMSAFPDKPDHFAQWLSREGLGQEGSFATRRNYGSYLLGLLEECRRQAKERLTMLTDEAVDVRCDDGGVHVDLGSGDRLDADIAVLAPGNLPPHDPSVFADLDAPAYIGDPWAADIEAGLRAQDQVMLLGSGLTAVDCALGLEAAGFRGRIIALSRRGLSPHSHAATPAFIPRDDRPVGSASTLTRAVRTRSAELGWRNAVDELRPMIQDMWRAATPDERSRFLRHLRPFWDIHRHRVAPEVAARLDRLRTAGRLEVRAAKVVKAISDGARLKVEVRGRGRSATETLHVDRIVNCTGPLGDLRRTTDGLLRHLAERGEIRPDQLAIGIDTDRQCHAIAADGSAHQRLFVVGPMTRGAHWEIVAVPDIRRQVWALAREITGSYWVEAEGL